MFYGDPVPASVPFTMTGFAPGETAASVVSGTATCSSAVTSASPVGKYPIKCDISGLSATNYVFKLVPGTITITQAPLTVTADNFSRLYGSPNPVFTGTVAGVRNNDTIIVSYGTGATASSSVGTYPIFPGVTATPASANYSITLVNGTLTITPLPLTVNVDSASRVYGDPNPAFTGTLADLRIGDNITAVYSSVATPASDVGTYPITATLVDPALRLANYTVTINNGTLTITPAPLTVTVANATRLYGSPNPVFTGTIVGLKNGDVITATYSSASPTSPVGTYAIVPPSWTLLVSWAITGHHLPRQLNHHAGAAECGCQQWQPPIWQQQRYLNRYDHWLEKWR